MERPPVAPAAKPEPEAPLEASLEELEAIVTRLESGEVTLEESIKLYERGRELGTGCLKSLEAFEKRVRLIRKKADGSLQEEDFASEDEESH